MRRDSTDNDSTSHEKNVEILLKRISEGVATSNSKMDAVIKEMKSIYHLLENRLVDYAELEPD